MLYFSGREAIIEAEAVAVTSSPPQGVPGSRPVLGQADPIVGRRWPRRAIGAEPDAPEPLLTSLDLRLWEIHQRRSRFLDRIEARLRRTNEVMAMSERSLVRSRLLLPHHRPPGSPRRRAGVA